MTTRHYINVTVYGVTVPTVIASGPVLALSRVDSTKCYGWYLRRCNPTCTEQIKSESDNAFNQHKC